LDAVEDSTSAGDACDAFAGGYDADAVFRRLAVSVGEGEAATLEVVAGFAEVVGDAAVGETGACVAQPARPAINTTAKADSLK
jgi:hypothetical protein